MLARRRRLTPAEVPAAGRDPAARTTTLHSLRLEREQLEHLAAVGIGVHGAERLIAGYDDLIAELEEAGVGGRRVTLTETQYARVGEVMTTKSSPPMWPMKSVLFPHSTTARVRIRAVRLITSSPRA